MRKRRYGKILSFALIFVLLASCFPAVVLAEGQTKGKIINVVYDDSGSMVMDNSDNYIKRWSQAKYALEVFCAMMGEEDKMNIFPMSKRGGLGLTLYGSDENRVKAVHEMNTRYSNTPFATVTAAANHLKGESGDYEKWLVVITDGAFDNGAVPTSTVQNTMNSYNDAGIRTVYLGIGDDAAVLQSYPDQGAYAEKAATGEEVLTKVTSIANQIFEHQVLSDAYISTTDGVTTLSIDIPTDQIVVFAQGDNASVGSLTLDGKTIKATSVKNVKFSDIKPSNYPNAVIDTSLKGVVSTFEAGDKPFKSGEFSVKVSNAKSVEYYYRPGVTVNCELLYNGRPVQKDDELYAGDYEIELSFVNPLTGKTVQSALLSDAVFTLKAQNNGQEQIVSEKKGSVSLVEGAVDIIASAELPGHVNLSSHKKYTVLPEPIELVLDFKQTQKEYTAASLGEKAVPILLTVSNAKTGEVLTAEESKATEIVMEEGNGIKWAVKRSDQAGVWELRPISTEKSIDKVDVDTYEFNVSASYQIGDQYAYGAGGLDFAIAEYAGSDLKIEIAPPAGKYDLNDMESPAGMLVTVSREDPQSGEYMPLTEEQWEDFELSADSDKRMSWKIEKGEKTGTWILTPAYYHGDALLTSDGQVQVTVTGEGSDGDLEYYGSATQTAEFTGLSHENFMKMLIPRVIGSVFGLWLIIGYLKKKRLRLKGLNPRCHYKNSDSSRQKISKDLFSVILPYVPEKATVKCHKSSFQCNFPDLRIQATGKRSFKIINKSMDLKSMKICGEFIDNMDVLKKRSFAFGSFDIASVNKKTGKTMGFFTFK